VGADKRIGRAFLNAGLGYGGRCFPKDIKAFISISEKLGEPFELLREVERINYAQPIRFLRKVLEVIRPLRDRRIAVWGLTFKPDHGHHGDQGKGHHGDQGKNNCQPPDKPNQPYDSNTE
jgi:UDPglucose 6-dehydrogenase